MDERSIIHCVENGSLWYGSFIYLPSRVVNFALGPIKDIMKVDNNSSFFMKFAAGSLAGAIGSTVSLNIGKSQP